MWSLGVAKQEEEVTKKVPAKEEAVVGTSFARSNPFFDEEHYSLLQVRRGEDVRERTKTKASEIKTSECVEVGTAEEGLVVGLCDDHSHWSCCCLEHTEEETTTALTEAWMTRILGGCPGQGERRRCCS